MIKHGLKLIDNSSTGFLLVEALSELLQDNSFSELSIATGYWDLPGMVEIFNELKTFLEKENTSVRLLLGEEPSVKAYQVKNPQMQDVDFPEKYLKRDLENLHLKEEFQQVANLLTEYIRNDNPKFKIKVYRKNFLHAKCYIFGKDSENAIGIIGSSNFTRQGLCGNLELNQLEDNNATVNFIRKDLSQFPSHRSWFEDLWNQSEDWSGIFKEEILALSKHGNICYSPYEMYVHALYRIYGQELEDEREEIVGADDPSTGKPQLLKFQIQNANSLIKKLERQSVAMLSDSVGLGKTYTALKVIEYYMQVKNQRVVVIAPAGLISQWRKAFDDFRMIQMPEIYSLQDIQKIEDVKLNLKSIPVGLFVFDESHNLRSSGGSRFEEFIRWRMHNTKAHTLMLTATPVNNQLSDLTNQIMLGSGGEIHKLGTFYDRWRQKYFTLKERLELLQKDIRAQIAETGSVDYQSVKEQLTPLLNRFIVRRTRQGIEKEYPDGLEINGLLQKFPVSYPENLEYNVPNQFKSQLLTFAGKDILLTQAYQYSIQSLAELDYLAHPLDLFAHYTLRDKPIQSSLEILYTGLLSLGFPCYRYQIYKWAYHGKKRTDLQLDVDANRELSRQIGIYGIFRTIFLKRLESSLYAIGLSVDSYERKLIDFKNKLEQFHKIVSVKNLALLNKAIDAYNEESSDEDDLDFDIDSFEQGNGDFTTLEAAEGVFNIPQLKEDIDKDLSILQVLKEQINLLIKKDDKIQVLAKELNKYEDKKVLVFTYFADTVNYLKDNLPKYLVNHRNIEFAIGNRNEIESYARKFAPVSKQYTLQPAEKEIDYLVATDKLSEGQNLQDCGIIINYDLHWNPVRMIQRNGRINRLGTKHQEIFIYNFRPTEQLESYLKLVRKLEDKINLIRYTIGSDQSVLDEEPIPQDFTEDLYSRDEKKRLEALNKIMETAEFLDAELIFLDELRAFDENPDLEERYKQKIKNLPKGKWGKLQKHKEEDEFKYLAHLCDKGGESGYFFTFNPEGILEQLTTAEGLLYIQTTSEHNQRFKDTFKNKPATEEMINRALVGYVMEEGESEIHQSDKINKALNYVMQKMQEYGYPVGKVEHVYNCGLSSKNAYINKQFQKQLRLINRLIRNDKHVDSKIYDELILLAESWNPDEKIDRPPIEEIVQIFEA